MFQSNYCLINQCTFSYTSDGVYVSQCSGPTISLCYFEQCTDGVFAGDSQNLIIKENTFHNNSNTGVYLDYIDNALIYWNNFTLNGDDSGYQAYDYQGTNNKWYEEVSQTGNYWDDYNPLDDNYTIDGTPVNYDLYPLLTPYLLIPEFSMIHLGFLGLLLTIVSVFVVITRFRKRTSF